MRKELSVYNLVGLADNATFVFTKTDTTVYSINGSPVENCAEGATHVGIFFKKAAKTRID